MRIGVRDHRVIAAFVDRKPADGRKLWTDGQRLDGLWLGGARIAEWAEGERGRQIVFRETGSRVGESVQRAVRRHAAPNQLAEFDPRGARRQAAKRRGS